MLKKEVLLFYLKNEMIIMWHDRGADYTMMIHKNVSSQQAYALSLHNVFCPLYRN